MAQQLFGTGPQTFDLGSALTGNHNVGVRGSVIATMEAFNTEFAALKALSGTLWTKLANGIIVMMGGAATNAGGSVAITFPFQFPNRITAFVATPNGGNNVMVASIANAVTTVFSSNASTGASSPNVSFSWIAIGY